MGEKILIVDDERVILDLTSMILRSRGYQVVTAENGLEGLEEIRRASPPLVLLDYMMPGMDGLTTLRKVREEFPDTYVIMFTGKGSEEIAVELMKAGASDYILKPFNNQDLVDRIENVLRIRRIELSNRDLREERELLLRQIEGWNQELERRVAETTRELEQAHSEVLQAEKLGTLGHLSAGMAHEVRNPLNSIGLFAQILKSALEGDEEKQGWLDKILKEIERIDGILIKLLNASKRPRYELSQVSIAAVIDGVLETFQDQIAARGIEVKRDYVALPPPLEADQGEIEQIFSNLFANSLYEMEQGGTLTIRLDRDERGILLEVADTGSGIPEENLRKIFDPFFTTKPRGTGFGLSVVLRIVKSYGGKISVKSEIGRGSVFHIEIPQSAHV